MGTIGRWFSGESAALTVFSAQGQPGEVGFVTKVPGRIVPVPIRPGRGMIVQASGYLCGEEGVDVKLHFQKKILGGLFGGEGFVLQRLSGNGMAFCEIDGEVVENRLGPQETLRVDTGLVAMFEETVDFDITMVKGFKNWLFGGEGLLLTTLRGPGKVWLQTLPFPYLVAGVAAAMPGSQGASGVGSLIGELIDRA